MQSRRHLRSALLILGLAVACGSCESLTGRNRTAANTVQQFAFVPVPQGMTLRTTYGESHSVQNGDYLFGRFVYSGDLGVSEISTYVKDRMAQDAWILAETNTPTQDYQELKFRRGVYTMDCSIAREEAKTMMRILVQTKVHQDAASAPVDMQKDPSSDPTSPATTPASSQTKMSSQTQKTDSNN